MLAVSAVIPVNADMLCSSLASLRAQFAVQNQPINQLHGSESHEEAVREINFFFPKQQTLAVIKPDAIEEHKGPFLFCIKTFVHTCKIDK